MQSDVLCLCGARLSVQRKLYIKEADDSGIQQRVIPIPLYANCFSNLLLMPEKAEESGSDDFELVLLLLGRTEILPDYAVLHRVGLHMRTGNQAF